MTWKLVLSKRAVVVEEVPSTSNARVRHVPFLIPPKFEGKRTHWLMTAEKTIEHQLTPVIGAKFKLKGMSRRVEIVSVYIADDHYVVELESEDPNLLGELFGENPWSLVTAPWYRTVVELGGMITTVTDWEVKVRPDPPSLSA